MEINSQALLPTQQFVQFAEMRPTTSSTGAASAQALACNLASILSFSSRSTADHLAKSLQLKLRNIGSNTTPSAAAVSSSSSSPSPSGSSNNLKEMTDSNNNASPTRSPTNSLPRLNGTTAAALNSLAGIPQQHLSPSSSSKYLLCNGTSKHCSNAEEEETSDEDSEDLRARMRRSSSLKSGKTPPGTPCRKKIVRFADALGLDLAEVRSFLDEIPNVPKSAYKDLDCALEAQAPPKLFTPFRATSNVTSSPNSSSFGKTMVSTFHQPFSRPDFFDEVRDKKVLLENAYCGDNFTIKGTVRVLNMDFHKSVYIRYSTDEWTSFTECQANYVQGSCDGFSDKFDFAISINPEKLDIGDKFMFAARFHCKGEQFWDSNNGQNYAFHVASSTASTSLSQNHSNLFNFQHSVYTPASMEDQWTTHMWM